MTDTEDKTMKRSPLPIRAISGLWLALLLMLPALSPAATILGLEADTAQGTTEVRLHLDTAPPEPRHFAIEKPARIAIDLPNTDIGEIERHRELGMGDVRSIDLVPAAGRTRAVLNLDRALSYKIERQGKTLLITIQGAAPKGSATDRAGTSKITDIDFRGGTNNAGRLIIRLSQAGAPMDVSREGSKTLVDLPATAIGKDLAQRYDVTDFATPVKYFDAFPREDGTRIAIQAQDGFEHLAYQADRTLTVEIKPLTPEQTAEAEGPQYTGEPVSLNFQDEQIRPIMHVLAETSGRNIVMSDAVQGSMSLRLDNVPWDQALDIILKSKGLSKRETGNVIRIAPTEEFAAQDRREREAKQEAQALAPLHSEFIQVNYAKAERLAELIRSEDNNFLSERGKITVDPRTNTLLVRDTDDNLEQVRKLVGKLDIPVKQVLIESRIVIATDQFTKELGTRFGATAVGSNGDSGIIAGSGSATGTDTMVGSALDNVESTGDPFPVGVPELGDRLNVDLPTTGSPAGTFALSLLGSDHLVDLEISAMQAEGKGEVISNPRVITSNNQEARIEQGTEIPYQTVSQDGTQVEFKKAVLAVEVTPQITPDEHIIMDINVTKDSVGEIFDGVPSIDTREVTTQVLMDNGETIVLGGIYEISNTDQLDKVPFLGDLPGVGRLFKRTLESSEKAELLIFVTPKIIQGELAQKMQ